MEKEPRVNNKYDIYEVETCLNKYIEGFVQQRLSASKNYTKEAVRFVLLCLLSFFIYKSYLHETPFPRDKPWIALCLAAYALLTGLGYLLDRYFIRKTFATFTLPRETLLGFAKKVAKEIGGQRVKLELFSQVKPFSSDYTFGVRVNDKSYNDTVQYENYIFSDGVLDTESLNALVQKTIQKVII